MSVASVIEGRTGRAYRTDLRDAPREFRGSIIDDWQIRPTRGSGWALVMAQQDGHYVLTLGRVRRARTLLARVLPWMRNLDREVAMPLAIPVEEVQSRAHARALTRRIARACVHDALPLPPRTDHDRAVWELTTVLYTAVAAVDVKYQTAREGA